MKEAEIASTFAAATEQFLTASDWIGPEHAPAVASLRLIAVQLDAELTAALAAQYGLVYRSLVKAKPPGAGVVDPVADAIGKLRGE